VLFQHLPRLLKSLNVGIVVSCVLELSKKRYDAHIDDETNKETQSRFDIIEETDFRNVFLCPIRSIPV